MLIFANNNMPSSERGASRAKAEGSCRKNTTAIPIFREGGFGEVNILTQTLPPLSSTHRCKTPKQGFEGVKHESPSSPTQRKEGAVAAQMCQFCCFLFLVWQVQTVVGKGVRGLLEEYGISTKPESGRDVALKFHSTRVRGEPLSGPLLSAFSVITCKSQRFTGW